MKWRKESNEQMEKVLQSSRAGSVFYDGSESENKSRDVVGTFPNSRQMIS